MNSEIKILNLLLDNKEKQFTIKKIAEQARINYRIAYEKVLQLEKDGLIKITPVGNAKICSLTYAFDSRLFEAEEERRKALFKKKNFLVLHRRLAELPFLFIALLFGSQAKGTATKQSDIDLLTIGGNETEIKRVLSLWPEKVHITTVSYQDFIHMAKSREFTVVSEALKNNIILVGIEEYYRLLENAGYKQD